MHLFLEKNSNACATVHACRWWWAKKWGSMLLMWSMLALETVPFIANATLIQCTLSNRWVSAVGSFFWWSPLVKDQRLNYCPCYNNTTCFHHQWSHSNSIISLSWWNSKHATCRHSGLVRLENQSTHCFLWAWSSLNGLHLQHWKENIEEYQMFWTLLALAYLLNHI